jgi:hypothetical protein
MLSMVSANRFINIGAIPLVTVAYTVFLCIEHNHNGHIADIKDHIQAMQNSGSLGGLVFGGSNAFYSLSAESLNYSTGMKWYNASMGDEMRSINRYEKFIQDLSTRIDRTKVKYVVYSSVLPYTIGELARHKVDRKVKGEGIKPNTSILGYIRNGATIYPEARNGFGDIVFDNVKCAAENPFYTLHEREKIGIFVDFLIDKAIYFASIFPNGSILIVLPSGLTFGDSMFDQALRTKFYSVLSEKYFENSLVKIIVQPPYSSTAQVCHSPWHANEDGRLWRTQNLIEFMRDGGLLGSAATPRTFSG